MSIKIKFPYQELKRRAAKVIDCHERDINSVTPAEGGTKFYVSYMDMNIEHWRKPNRVVTLTVWQIVDALPLADISGSVETFWSGGLSAILAILGFTQPPKSEKEVKRAYLKMVKIHHPDLGGDPNAFRQLVFAYESLIALLPNLSRG
jgi:ABC-type Fe3+-hydroxamate transport system substrate-binding protein